MKFGFIGCGNMGGAIARGVVKAAGGEQVLLANKTMAKIIQFIRWPSF